MVNSAMYVHDLNKTALPELKHPRLPLASRSFLSQLTLLRDVHVEKIIFFRILCLVLLSEKGCLEEDVIAEMGTSHRIDSRSIHFCIHFPTGFCDYVVLVGYKDV
jgi:hypothetical protein